MMAFCSRLTKTISALACALCAAGAFSAWAQEAATVLPNGGQCPTAGAPPVDALDTPHWNGGVSMPRSVDSNRRKWRSSLRRIYRASS
jgi:hypothetical protein